jgi:hypothetical protein
VCTVTDVIDGATHSVSVVVGGSGQAVTVQAAGVADARLRDTYLPIVPVTG